MSGGSTMWSSTLIRIMSSLFMPGPFKGPYRMANSLAIRCPDTNLRRRISLRVETASMHGKGDYGPAGTQFRLERLSAAARVRIRLRRVVPHPPVLTFRHDRLAGVAAVAMFDVAPVVVVAHQ